ncbi:MAG: META domain-containing protein [Bacteroidetes bacterium]|nr:MAG: META domain-containing protein [Bacteroidota bacterium]
MKFPFLLSALFTLLLVNCDKNTTEDPDLTDYTWTLISVNGKTVPDSVVATLYLSPTQPVCNGSGGCNVYGADYMLSDNTLTFDNLISTEIACQGKMNWEMEFFHALLNCQTYTIQDGELRLSAGSEILAVLE